MHFLNVNIKIGNLLPALLTGCLGPVLPLHVSLQDEFGFELLMTNITIVVVLVFQPMGLGHVLGEIIVFSVTLLTRFLG